MKKQGKIKKALSMDNMQLISYVMKMYVEIIWSCRFIYAERLRRITGYY